MSIPVASANSFSLLPQLAFPWLVHVFCLSTAILAICRADVLFGVILSFVVLNT